MRVLDYLADQWSKAAVALAALLAIVYLGHIGRRVAEHVASIRALVGSNSDRIDRLAAAAERTVERLDRLDELDAERERQAVLARRLIRESVEEIRHRLRDIDPPGGTYPRPPLDP